VKLRDLAGRDDFEEMLTNPSKDMSSYRSSTDDAQFYFAPAGSSEGINYAKLCYERIVEEHFRGDDEAWNFAVDSDSGLAVASVANVPGWLDSFWVGDDVSAVDVSISTAGDNAFTVSELQVAMNEYQLAKLHGLTQMSFEDYLMASGVRGAAAQEDNVPELLGMEREWTYPTNNVEPTDGSVASAWIWSTTMRRNNAKFFPEPGFVIGLTLVRPKVYFEGLTASPALAMDAMDRWLPPQLRNNERSGQSGWAAATGPAGGAMGTEAYRYSIDDLFLFGDQWTNYALDTGTNSVALPLESSNAVNIRYPSAADINDLFVDAANASGLRFIRQDGIVNLSVDSYLRNSIEGLPISN
jgi:hypothetical protein